MNFTETQCPTCGIKYQLPCFLLERLQRTGDTHYCPFGHPQEYRDGWKRKVAEAPEWESLYRTERSDRWSSETRAASLNTQVKNLKAKNKGKKKRKAKGAK